MDYRFKAKVLKIVDGDTVDLEVILIDELRDLGFKNMRRDFETTIQRFRITSLAGGIDAPERSAIGGTAATLALSGMIPPGAMVDIQTFKDATGGFGRYLAIIWSGEVEIGKWLVESNHAVMKSY